MELKTNQSRHNQHEADRRELFIRAYCASAQGSFSSGKPSSVVETNSNSLARAALKAFDMIFTDKESET